MSFDLSKKVALVTGGSRGIGRAVSVALARAGAYVAINYRAGEQAAGETLRLVEAAGSRGEVIRFDVAEAQAVEAAVTDLTKRLGRLDILVNNAGIAIDQLIMRVKKEDMSKTWATNLDGAFWCCKEAIRPMMRARSGRIINVSSVVGEAGNPGQAVYSASKAALIGLTKTLAREYASRGVTVNAIAPGFIETDMTSALTDAQRTGIVGQIPLARIGKPEEVAAAVVYLASDEAAYVTGHVLRINGGMYM